MSELVPSRRRTLYQRGPLRRALLDTSVLTSDVIAATRRRDPSSIVAGARAGTVRCLIPVHVWEEVPRVLGDRHREGGRFDLGQALALWHSQYLPVLWVVDAAGLPMTPEAEVLAGRDASDVPMLLLAGVIAPVVTIGTDKDLVASGLADADYVALRAALGKVGVTEGRMADLERQAGVLANVTGRLVKAVVNQATEHLSVRQTVAAVALAGTVVGALVWQDRRHPRPRVLVQRQRTLHVVLKHAWKGLEALEVKHTQGEDRWHQAERGMPGDTLLHRVARTLVGSPDPMTRTAIVERLGGHVPGAGHVEQMAAVRGVLTAHPMFADVSGRGHWQVGRLGGP
ncbi:PIN domain-containing protein [Streptomyces sp. NPDC059957]|uniref:PIN domain-containing protein n=1 Tax=unclassified Streptomyces TaxID=2593676 RepID=UPI00364E397A